MAPKRKASTVSAVDSKTSTSTRPKRAAATKASQAVVAKTTPDPDSDDAQPQQKKLKTDNDGDEPATIDAGDEVDGAESTKKMVTVIKRGKVPVDPHSEKAYTHQVLESFGEVWDAALNQTNVIANNNKFYVIQLLHLIGQPEQAWMYTRWGRVGEGGSSQLKGPFAIPSAISTFKSQFRSKTGVAWEGRVGMTTKKGKYTWIERDHDDSPATESPSNAHGSSETLEREPTPECTLEPQVMNLCQLIFSTKLIDAALSSMNYDAKKMPLGKLAKSTVLKGFETLKLLAEVLNDPKSSSAAEFPDATTAYAELTSRYYSIIPHDFGRMRPTVISNEVMLKKELELVDALGDMEIASKLIDSGIHLDTTGKAINPFDFYFRSLDLLYMEPVAKDSREFEALKTYTHGTHGKTHYFKCSIEAAFRVERQGEKERWENANHDLPPGGRLLLWHGSRATNFAGILKQGLRIAPPEAPVTGYMFGKGVYFADMMSKSAGYTYYQASHNTALLLLCEVAVKPLFELTQADYNAESGCRKENKLATKGIGRTQPNGWQDAGEMLDYDALKGCHMPTGGASDLGVNTSLQYNEYIVYDVNQIRLRYLIQLKME